MNSRIYILLFILLLSLPLVSATGTADIQYSNPILGLFMSDYWMYVVVLFIVGIIFVPTGIKGWIDMWKWFDRRMIKPGKGYIEVEQKLPNDHNKHFLVKPTGKLIRFKSIDGKNKIEIPVNLGKNWIVIDNGLPKIFLDENSRQQQISSNIQLPSNISQEEMTRGLKFSYDTGKQMATFDMMGEMRTYLLIAICVIVAINAVSIYFAYQNMQSLNNLPTAQRIAMEVRNSLYNTSVNPTPVQNNIPTVGG